MFYINFYKSNTTILRKNDAQPHHIYQPGGNLRNIAYTIDPVRILLTHPNAPQWRMFWGQQERLGAAPLRECLSAKRSKKSEYKTGPT